MCFYRCKLNKLQGNLKNRKTENVLYDISDLVQHGRLDFREKP